MRDRLLARVDDFDGLCDLDSSLVMAQRACDFSSDRSGGELLAPLMLQLALNWRLLKKWERADQVYRRAFELHMETGWAMIQLDLLRTWSFIKSGAGDANAAIALARLRTTIARNQYAHPDYDKVESGELKPQAARDLVQALRDEAFLLDQADFVEDARIAAREAQALEVAVPSCEQVPCEPVIYKIMAPRPIPCEAMPK